MLKNSAAYLEGRIPSKTRLVVFRVASDNSQRALTEYIEDYITASLVNAQKFTVVDRHNLEVIQQELDFQTRGDVDNRTAASIGKKAGAQTIVLGAYDGKFKRLTIRAIDVETASVRAIRSNMLIKEDAIFKALSGKHAGSKIGRPF